MKLLHSANTAQYITSELLKWIESLKHYSQEKEAHRMTVVISTGQTQ
jgi:hypothetical protein